MCKRKNHKKISQSEKKKLEKRQILDKKEKKKT